MPPELLTIADPLDQLLPIIPPEHDVSWWPLASGWWILLGTVCVMLLLTWWLRPILETRRIEKKRWESAYSLLQALYDTCQTQKDSSIGLQEYLQNSNAIFKRVINHFGKDPEITAFSGKKWVNFLAKIYPGAGGEYAHLYGESLYAKRCTENVTLEGLHAWAYSWLTALKKQIKDIPRVKENV